MRRRIRRAMAFALVPLSALPLVFAAPQIAPSFEQRIDELLGRGDQPHQIQTPPTTSEGRR